MKLLPLVSPVVAVAFLVACSGSPTPQAVTGTVAQQSDALAYGAQEQSCVANADGSLSAAEACIHAVQAYWCGDGGPLYGYCAGQSVDAGAVAPPPAPLLPRPAFGGAK